MKLLLTINKESFHLESQSGKVRIGSSAKCSIYILTSQIPSNCLSLLSVKGGCYFKVEGENSEINYNESVVRKGQIVELELEKPIHITRDIRIKLFEGGSDIEFHQLDQFQFKKLLFNSASNLAGDATAIDADERFERTRVIKLKKNQRYTDKKKSQRIKKKSIAVVLCSLALIFMGSLWLGSGNKWTEGTGKKNALSLNQIKTNNYVKENLLSMKCQQKSLYDYCNNIEIVTSSSLVEGFIENDSSVLFYLDISTQMKILRSRYDITSQERSNLAKLVKPQSSKDYITFDSMSVKEQEKHLFKLTTYRLLADSKISKYLIALKKNIVIVGYVDKSDLDLHEKYQFSLDAYELEKMEVISNKKSRITDVIFNLWMHFNYKIFYDNYFKNKK